MRFLAFRQVVVCCLPGLLSFCAPTSIQPIVRVTTTVKDSHVVDDAFFHTVHNISANLNERKNKELGLWPYSSVSSDILGDFFSKKNNGQG
jgi:hypothetical protein